MTDPPEVRITAGSPTPGDEAAVRAAIVALWRADVAAAVRAEGMRPWTLAGRAQALRRGAAALRDRSHDAWRLAGRLGDHVSAISIGRGDAR